MVLLDEDRVDFEFGFDFAEFLVVDGDSEGASGLHFLAVVLIEVVGYDLLYIFGLFLP